jgi:hypothetical protein
MQGRGEKLTHNMLMNECGYERVDDVEVSDRLELYIPSLDKGATPGRELKKKMEEEGMRMKWRKGKSAIYLYQRS